jgi:hypothetical protein
MKRGVNSPLHIKQMSHLHEVALIKKLNDSIIARMSFTIFRVKNES